MLQLRGPPVLGGSPSSFRSASGEGALRGVRLVPRSVAGVAGRGASHKAESPTRPTEGDGRNRASPLHVCHSPDTLTLVLRPTQSSSREPGIRRPHPPQRELRALPPPAGDRPRLSPPPRGPHGRAGVRVAGGGCPPRLASEPGARPRTPPPKTGPLDPDPAPQHPEVARPLPLNPATLGYPPGCPAELGPPANPRQGGARPDRTPRVHQHQPPSPSRPGLVRSERWASSRPPGGPSRTTGPPLGVHLPTGWPSPTPLSNPWCTAPPLPHPTRTPGLGRAPAPRHSVDIACHKRIGGGPEPVLT